MRLFVVLALLSLASFISAETENVAEQEDVMRIAILPFNPVDDQNDGAAQLLDPAQTDEIRASPIGLRVDGPPEQEDVMRIALEPSNPVVDRNDAAPERRDRRSRDKADRSRIVNRYNGPSNRRRGDIRPRADYFNGWDYPARYWDGYGGGYGYGGYGGGYGGYGGGYGGWDRPWGYRRSLRGYMRPQVRRTSEAPATETTEEVSMITA